jgi:4-amino-4-deoxy-L-arabinose transferase-like glycosyltransferase
MADSSKDRDSPSGRRRSGAWAAAAGAAVLALAFTYAERHVLVSPQGSQCLRAAWNFAASGTLDVAPGRPFSWFGPLYPVLLGGLARAGLSPVSAVALVNSVALIAAFALFAGLARRMTPRSTWPATLFFIGLATNAYLFRMARPDIFMLPATLLMIFGLVRYAERGRRADLLLAAAACALATTARYMAIFTLAPLVLVGVWLAWRRSGRARVLHAILFLTVAWAPVALWLLRNRARTGYLTGMSRTAWREAAASSDFASNLVALLRSFALDFFGVRSMGVVSQVHGGASPPHPTATAFVGCVAAAFALGGCVLLLRRRHTAASGAPPAHEFTTRLVALAAGAYLVTLLALWTWGNNDPIHTRYVAPVYGLLVLLGFRAAERAHRPVRIAFAVAALAIFVPNLDKTALLMGEAPTDALIRVSLHGERDLWVRPLSWQDVLSRPGRAHAEP